MIRRFIKIAKDHEIVYSLVVKELKVRYRGSYLGFLYALLNPLVTAIVFSIVFSLIIRIKQDDFALFLLCGIMPWVFFQQSLSQASTSIIHNSNLIKKVMLPREIFPISSILSCLVNFILGLCVLLPFLAAYGRVSWNWAFLPLILIVHLVFTLGIGLFLAATNVMFRDIGNLIEIVLFVWFYGTPIFYPLHMVQDGMAAKGWSHLFPLYLMNPMASIITLYRHALFEAESATVLKVAVPVAIVSSVLALVIGQFVFQKLQKNFAKEL